MRFQICFCSVSILLRDVFLKFRREIKATFQNVCGLGMTAASVGAGIGTVEFHPLRPETPQMLY